MRELVALGLPDFALYSGDDATARDSILAGFHGDISVTANVAPEGDGPRCARPRSRATRRPPPRSTPTSPALHRALFVEPNPIPVKWALAELGLIDDGHPAAAGPARPGAPRRRPRGPAARACSSDRSETPLLGRMGLPLRSGA